MQPALTAVGLQLNVRAILKTNIRKEMAKLCQTRSFGTSSRRRKINPSVIRSREALACEKEVMKKDKKIRPHSAPSILSKRRKPSLIVPETIPLAQLQMDATNCPNCTSAEYWDTMGKDWEGEIMSSLDEDVNGVIKECLVKYSTAKSSSVAVDFGCGVGIYVPALSTRFENVIGLDISRRLIARARSDCAAKGIFNVRFKRADLATCDIQKIGLANAADLTVCANVLISPEPHTRNSILSNATATLRPDGYLMLVVPACRSAQLCQEAHGVWIAERRRLKVKPYRKRDEFPEATNVADERKGIFQRDGVRTKHFRASELRTLLGKHALEVVVIDRVEYDWLTEFKAPVDILYQKFDERPFDWIVIAKKVSK